MPPGEVDLAVPSGRIGGTIHSGVYVVPVKTTSVRIEGVSAPAPRMAGTAGGVVTATR